MSRGLVLLGMAGALAAGPALACSPPEGFGAHQRIASPRFVVLYRTVLALRARDSYFSFQAFQRSSTLAAFSAHHLLSMYTTVSR